MTQPTAAVSAREALVAFDRGHYGIAEALARRVLRWEPEDILGVLVMSRLALLKDDLLEASSLVESVSPDAVAADDSGLLAALADVCFRCELYSQALNCYDRLSSGGDPGLSYRLGVCCWKLGRLTQAEQHYQACIALRPEVGASYLQLGHVYRALGQFEAAAEQYRSYIERDPGQSGHGYWSLADLKQYRFGDDEIAAMSRDLENARPGSIQASTLHFALGKCAEDGADPVTALQHYHQGNAIQAATKPFNQPQFLELTNSLLAVTELPDSETEATHLRPIFIVGLPRSGTTLIEQILAAHSRVGATDELPLLGRFGLELEMLGGYGQLLPALDGDTRTRLRERYLRNARDYIDGDVDYFIDKNPSNFMHLGLIKVLFPDALVIDSRRDPRDNAISAYRQLFNVGNQFSWRFDTITLYYQRYLQLMSHWEALCPGWMYLQSFEDLIEDSQLQIEKLLEYCELEPEQGCFRYWESGRAVMTPSASQVSQPPDGKAIGQWRRFESELPVEFERLRMLVSGVGDHGHVQ